MANFWPVRTDTLKNGSEGVLHAACLGLGMVVVLAAQDFCGNAWGQRHLPIGAGFGSVAGK